MIITERDRAFAAMKKGSLPGIEEGSTIYGIETATMDMQEMRIALHWALSQAARALGPEKVGSRH